MSCPDNLTRPKKCPHCGIVTTAANIGRWHGDRCLEANPDGHKGQNANLNKAAIYIDLTTEEVRYFSSFGAAAAHYGGANSAIFGQVLRGRGCYMNQVVLRLHQFLAADADEISDLLDHARARRRRGYRPHRTNEPEHTTAS